MDFSLELKDAAYLLGLVATGSTLWGRQRAADRKAAEWRTNIERDIADLERRANEKADADRADREEAKQFRRDTYEGMREIREAVIEIRAEMRRKNGVG